MSPQGTNVFINLLANCWFEVACFCSSITLLHLTTNNIKQQQTSSNNNKQIKQQQTTSNNIK